MKNTCAIMILASMTAAACGPSEPEEPAPAASSGSEERSADRQGEDQSLRGHMAANFRLALDTRDAIIQGNLAGAQQQAKDLAWQSYEGVLPERWMPGVEKMQLAARNIAQSSTLEQAALHASALAATCGECHARFESTGEDTAQDHGFSSKGSEDLQTRMLRHQSAADRFWFGLTIPSDASWRSGARALTEAPEGPVIVDGQPASPQLEQQMEALREVGKRALAAETTTERVQLYGEFLADCSRCHAQ